MSSIAIIYCAFTFVIIPFGIAYIRYKSDQ